MSNKIDKIINVSSAGTPVIDITNIGNHLACPNCKEANKTIKILEKALELACLVISKEMCPNGDWKMLKKDFANAYKQQAEKEINNE